MGNTVLGNRYELLEKIGEGGMALVYKAKCKLLNRFVAIKILREEFTKDEELVKKFIIENESAANLSHPNIASIYDVCYKKGIHYIAMEYVDGITLKEFIKRKAPLKWKEAVNISMQICSALDHAHKKNIIHGDIKPSNIMMTKDGIAKVTDFGIARAFSSNLTPMRSIAKSVHYYSPEQARGECICVKSDIYSLGITLYEMLTGKVPFIGETAAEIALKHMRQEVLLATSINSNIPLGVNDIINKAIQKVQSERYQSAQKLLEDMNKVFIYPSRNFFIVHDIGIEIRSKPKTIEHYISEDEYDTKKSNELLKEKDQLTRFLVSVLSILVTLSVAYISFKVVISPIYTTKDVIVGNYTGKKIDEVERFFADSKIIVNKKDINDDSGVGTILKQDIEPGKTLKVGGYRTIALTVSIGEKLVLVPNLINLDYKIAEIELKNLEIIPFILEEFSESVAQNMVIRTSPITGEKVRSGSTVTIFKSKGPEPKIVKDF